MAQAGNIVDGSRTELVDKYVPRDLLGENFEYHVFIRLGAKKRNFRNVNFNFVIFQDCYLRNCFFEDCTFIGCVFRDSQFDGSRFEGCDFKYARFENTWFDEEILESSCPSWDNTRWIFARSLRTNYKALGDARLESKAAKIEIGATISHYYKAWSSNESYYRKKYTGWKRVACLLRWLSLKFSSWVWGNGESVGRLMMSTSVLLLYCAYAYIEPLGKEATVQEVLGALRMSLAVLLGSESASIGVGESTFISLARLVLSGLFLAVIIRKLGYR